VPVTRATVVGATPFTDPAAAERWLEGIGRDRGELEAEAGRAIATVNRALHAYAIAGHDPGIAQLARAAALAVRVGFGSGEELADSRWTRAVEVPHRPERVRRADALRPIERLAAVLGGRERPDACETMLVRARSDLDGGRDREAALQLRLGLEALLAELGEDPGPEQSADLAELADRRDEVAATADRALRGEIGTEGREALAATLAIAERILRRRRILGG
jgi:hypothetical protein